MIKNKTFKIHNLRLNKLIRKIYLILIGILIYQSSQAQENYLPGYIINIKGDTIKGFIDYKNWKRNPNNVGFKDLKEGNPILYSPEKITEFNVKDEIYISGIVHIEVTPIQTNLLKTGSELKIKTDTVFLQTLFKGTKSLYYFNSSSGKDNFYIKHGSTLQLLKYKKYLIKAGGGVEQTTNVIKENKKYLGQLSAYLSDCPTIMSKLENTNYEKKSLEKLFSYYYKCSSYDIIFQNTTKKIATEFGILAGITISSLEFDGQGEGSQFLSEGEFNNSTDFTVGLFFDIILPRNQGKWSINNELIYTSYKLSDLYIHYDSEEIYSIISTKLNYSYLKLNTLIRYKYAIGDLFIYLNGGISNGYAINDTNYKKTVRKIYSIEKINEGEAVSNARKYEQGIVLGLGVKYAKFSIELRHERGNGMGTSNNLNSISKRNYLLIGYRF